MTNLFILYREIRHIKGKKLNPISSALDGNVSFPSNSGQQKFRQKCFSTSSACVDEIAFGSGHGPIESCHNFRVNGKLFCVAHLQHLCHFVLLSGGVVGCLHASNFWYTIVLHWGVRVGHCWPFVWALTHLLGPEMRNQNNIESTLSMWMGCCVFFWINIRNPLKWKVVAERETQKGGFAWFLVWQTVFSLDHVQSAMLQIEHTIFFSKNMKYWNWPASHLFIKLLINQCICNNLFQALVISLVGEWAQHPTRQHFPAGWISQSPGTQTEFFF